MNRHRIRIYASVAALHLIVIWFYRIPFVHRIDSTASSASEVLMAAGTDMDPLIQQHPMVRDPLIMSQANAKGYTGKLWHKSFESPNAYRDWGESPRYLLRPATHAGSALRGLTEAYSLSLRDSLQKNKPQLPLNQVAPLSSTFKPTLILSPEIQHRSPETVPEFPEWTGSTPMLPTRLEIGIDALGFVQSVRLIGPPPPDGAQVEHIQKGISKIKQLRFTPLSQSEINNPPTLTRGGVTLSWQSLEKDPHHPPANPNPGETR